VILGLIRPSHVANSLRRLARTISELGHRRSNGMDFRRGILVRLGPIPLAMDRGERHRHRRRRRRRHNNGRYL